MSLGARLLSIDRRVIFLLVAVAVALPIIFDLSIPIYQVTPEVLGVFDKIDALPARAGIMIVFDYEPAATPELDPMAEAILRHCFKKDLRIVTSTLYSSAPGLVERALKTIGDEYGKLPGIDYTFLGYRPGGYAVIQRIVGNIKDAYQEDYYKNATKDLPVLDGLNRMKDFEYLMVLHDDSTVATWVIYGHEPTGIETGSGCTAVMATGSYPFLHSGQVTGIIGGLKGAAEYEKLLDYEGQAHQGMFSQSVVHILIIVLIVLGNVGHYLQSRKGVRV